LLKIHPYRRKKDPTPDPGSGCVFASKAVSFGSRSNGPVLMSIAPERTRSVFQKVERDLLKISSKQDAESVHRFRTGTRRLQTLLEEIIPERDRNEKKLLRMLGRIRKRAGSVRDVDMQLAALRSLKMPQEPRRKTQLLNNLIDLRAKHEKKLRKALTDEEVRGIRTRLKRAARDLNLKRVRDPLAVARQILAQIAPANGPVTDEQLHAYRMLGKRARYAAEFAAKSPEGDQFVSQVERIQDALGDWHDWLTLTQSAAERLGDLHESPLVAELHNVTGAKFRYAVAVLSAMSHPAPKPAAAAQSGVPRRQAGGSRPKTRATSAA
jgi:CHAD domain-containing protein